jgi:hypothetical protein
MRDMDAYNKQKALYLSQIIKHNEENPSNPLPVRITTDLVDGYTLNQIEEIKHLSDAIYGSYDASTKAAYENLALGSQLGVFSTWMNGIYDVWLGRRRTSSYETMKKQAVDDNGNKLWIDEEGRIVTTETDTPYMDDVPLVVQGILRTVGDAFTMLYHGKSVSEIYKEMKLNPM